MNNIPRSYSGIFRLFAYDKLDKTGALFERVGTLGFAFSFLGSTLGLFLKGVDRENSTLFDIAIGIFGIGFFVGIFMFIATGIHYAGQEKGKTNFLSSTFHVFKNTFLFLLLPALIITVLLIGWAVLTKQPAIR